MVKKIPWMVTAGSRSVQFILCSLGPPSSLGFSVGVVTALVEIPRILEAGPKRQVPGALALSCPERLR